MPKLHQWWQKVIKESCFFSVCLWGLYIYILYVASSEFSMMYISCVTLPITIKMQKTHTFLCRKTLLYILVLCFFVIVGYLVHCMKWGGCRNNRRKLNRLVGEFYLALIYIFKGKKSSIFSHTKTGKYQSGKF